MSLRVIAGKARGMKLKAVPGEGTRPVMDRVKEALFSIIGSDIQGANFLDLFAGTGSVGIEALSRGANFASFVELDRRALNVVQANLVHTGLADRGRVLRRDAFNVLAGEPDRHYDFIYVAPPQYKDMWHRTLDVLDKNHRWRHADSLVIVQVDPIEFDAERGFMHLEAIDQRKYGRTMLIFYCFVDEYAGSGIEGEDIG